MNPSHLMGIAFEVYHTWEARKIKQAMVFLEIGWQDQKKRCNPKAKRLSLIHI